VLNLVEPRGVQRGTEAEIQLHGERLENPQQLLFYQPGIELLTLTARDPQHVVARLRIAPDAPLGEHPLRLRTSGGITWQRTLWVGQFPVVFETEPNNSFDAPQPVPFNTTIQGIADREDADYFLVPLKKGQVLAVEVEAMRLGRTMFDVALAVVGPDRFELAVADDTALLRNDAFASLIAPADGEYRVLVREAAYEGNSNCEYRLHVGGFPRPAAVFPPGARPGEAPAFSFLPARAETPAAAITLPLTIPADAAGRFPLFATQAGLSAPSPNWIMVSPFAAAAEGEPNDAPHQATALAPPPCAGHGVLAKPGDADWFRVAAKKDQRLDFRVLGRSLRSPVDPVLVVHDAAGKQLAVNDDQGGLDSRLSLTAPADGELLVNVRDHLGRHGNDFTYRLEVAPPVPAISASLPVVERNNSQKWKTICVPRVNRYATVVNITRDNLACDATFTADSLPAGVTLATPPIPRSLQSFPAVFEAAADAPLAGGLHRFTIRTTGANTPQLAGPLHETIHHIEINNEGPYHTTESDYTPVAVVEPAPVRIEVDPPAVPLVRNGTLALTVRAVRAAGFAGPVTARFLWSPPGIGAPVTVDIPPDKTEARYELNAAADAPVADWQVCVLGEANTPQGPVLVASALVPLQVVEPFLSLSLELAATEQGKHTAVVGKLEIAQPFDGAATATLHGLPHGAATTPLNFSKADTQLTFPLTIAPDAVIGKHTGLFCRVAIPRNGQAITHTVGQGGTLRIDQPTTPPPATAQTAAQPAAAPPPRPAAAKPLSRLEQLRQRGQ
jgi:hypothetical protein